MSVITEVEAVAPEQTPEQTHEQRVPRATGRRAPRRGSVPEPALAAVLSELAGEGWVVLSDLAWPGRWSTPLAHAVVGPAGVVVIDTDPRPWRLTAANGLRLGLRAGTRERRTTSERAADVASLLRPEHREAVLPVLCLTSQPLPAVAVEHGVTATGPSGLATALRQLPGVLDTAAVREVGAHLAHYLAARTEVVDRGAALLGLVPAPRAALTAAVPVAGLLSAPAPAPVAQQVDEQMDGLVDEKVDEQVAGPEIPTEPVVHATRREAIAAERAQGRRRR